MDQGNSTVKKILLTGGSSGLGEALRAVLEQDSVVASPSRQDLDLQNPTLIADYIKESFDMLINCAGTGIGGKQTFVEHDSDSVLAIMNTNLVSPMLLAQRALQFNADCKIVNITSTNNKHYYPGDLAYSLSKKSLEYFGHMLQLEHKSYRVLEVRLGLTRTNFNRNRYANEPQRYQEIYHNRCLEPAAVALKIQQVLWDDDIKFLEIAP